MALHRPQVGFFNSLLGDFVEFTEEYWHKNGERDAGNDKQQPEANEG